MEIEVFTLCDGAFNYNGKLTVVGTYDTLNVQSVPFSARVALAIKLNLDVSEIHTGTQIKVIFKNSEGTSVSSDIVNTIGALPEGAQVCHVAMAVNANLNITVAGAYSAELYVNETLIKRKDFNVACVA